MTIQFPFGGAKNGMDETTLRALMSSVDATGKPKWVPETVDDLPAELAEQIPVATDDVVDRPATSHSISAHPAQPVPNIGHSSAEPAGEAGDQLTGSWVPAPTIPVSSATRDTRALMVGGFITIGVFLLAVLPRLFVLFAVTDPQNPGIGWYGDVYHHWQIAYLSKTVGFSEGFLRLWDFKGLEFFWGLLHPLALIILFTITGSVDIVIPRLLSTFAASASIVMLFFLLRRYFNIHVAIAGVLLAALNPIAVFNDTVGMQEPLGIALLFGGLLLLDRRPALAGVVWAMAGMVRAEYWVFGAALVGLAIVSGRYSKQKLQLAVGWAAPTLLYMKYMLNYTGNPIYPIYWNFLAGTAGKWIADIPMNEEQIQAQSVARVVLVLAAAASFWILRKRPRGFLFLLLGLGNIMMIGIVLGLGEYVRGYIARVLIDRLLVLPYLYAGILLIVLLLYVLPELNFRSTRLAFGWSVFIVGLLVSQWAWKPILGYYTPLNDVWTAEKQLADDVAAQYQGGTVSIPEDRPYLTYALVQYHGISGENIDGQMYDAFAYIEGDPFERWDEGSETIRNWLDTQDIKLLVFYSGKWNYEEMIRREPGWFNQVSTANRGTVQIYQVLSQ